MNSQAPVHARQVHVVDFKSDVLNGLHTADGVVSLARRVLSDRDETLRLLVHEVAHKRGHDGAKAHVQEMERIWSGIVSELRNVREG